MPVTRAKGALLSVWQDSPVTTTKSTTPASTRSISPTSSRQTRAIHGDKENDSSKSTTTSAASSHPKPKSHTSRQALSMKVLEDKMYDIKLKNVENLTVGKGKPPLKVFMDKELEEKKKVGREVLTDVSVEFGVSASEPIGFKTQTSLPHPLISISASSPPFSCKIFVDPAPSTPTKPKITKSASTGRVPLQPKQMSPYPRPKIGRTSSMRD